MKGLILKDYYCLKKGTTFFLAITLGVIIIGLMFAISIHYGNMGKAVEEVVAAGDLTEEGMYDLFRLGIWTVLLIPIAFVGNVIDDCFKADTGAEFGKMLFSMPVTPWQMVGARYISCLMYAATSVVGSLVAAILISCASKYYPISELMGVVALFACVLLTYLGIVMMFLYIFGTRHADVIQSLPILAAAAAVVIYFIKSGAMTGAQEDAILGYIISAVKNYVHEYVFIGIVVTIILLFVTCVVSVKVVEKRRVASVC